MPKIDLNHQTNQRVKENTNFSIYHQNIQCLTSKLEELSICANNIENGKNKVDVICLTEHHLKPWQIQYVTLPCFTLGSYYCRSTLEKGGACIFLRETVSYIPLELSKYCIEQDIECCGVKICTKNNNDVILLTIYRAPVGNFQVFITKLDEILSSLFSVRVNFILCGDFNVDYLVESTQKKLLNSLLTSFDMMHVVNFPTRITHSTSTAIDNIFINNSKRQSFTIVPIANGLSDHDAQVLNINYNLHNLKGLTGKVRFRQINKYTLDQLKSSLGKETWDLLMNENDPNKQYNIFLQIVLLHFEACCPLKVSSLPRKSKQQNAWLTKGIVTSCNTKRILYLKARETGLPGDKTRYKIYCKILQKVIMNAKSKYLASLITNSSNKIKTMWNIVKSETSTLVNQNELLELEIKNNIITDKSTMALELNKYFLNVANDLVNKINKSPNPMTYVRAAFPNKFPDIRICKISCHEMSVIIKNMKLKPSCGYDEISSKIVKHCVKELSWPLTLICNNSLASGIFPDRLKYATVIPLHKKGNKTKMGNYRPISLLSTFSKILEKVMYNCLLKHIMHHKILTTSQFGFQKNMSTENAIFKLTTEILEALNNHEAVISIFYDLAKAFDCVNHKILIEKLEYYGIRNNFKNLFESYLTSRIQSVVIKDKKTGTNATSEPGIIHHGVPQGSILGPLLFLIYINDLPSAIQQQAVAVLFADDTSILINNKSTCELVKVATQVLNTLDDWFSANKLTVNIDKTNFIAFATRSSVPKVNQLPCRVNEIQQTKDTKFLGVQINEKLDWSSHVEKITGKLSSACYVLRCMSYKLNSAALKTMYFAYFHSIMKYGIIFWGNSAKAKKIFILQKKALRLVCRKKIRESCKPLFMNWKVLTLPCQYIYSLLVFLSKNFDLFQVNSSIHSHFTRTQNNIHYPINNLSMYQKGTYYTAIKLFNKLPRNLKEMCEGNNTSFNKRLKSYLITNAFYSLNEFLDC